MFSSCLLFISLIFGVDLPSQRKDYCKKMDFE